MDTMQDVPLLWRLTVATVSKSLPCLDVSLGEVLDVSPHSLVGSMHLAKPSSFDNLLDPWHYEQF